MDINKYDKLREDFIRNCWNHWYGITLDALNMTIKYVEEDISKCNYQYIAHQCNCTSKYFSGLAKTLFDEYPYADTYTNRLGRTKMGTISVHCDGDKDRYIINMYAQIFPGPPKTNDVAKDRLTAFRLCMAQILKIKDLKSIAFPYKIGCGLAQGNWTEYLNVIKHFAAETKAEVYICRKDLL